MTHAAHAEQSTSESKTRSMLRVAGEIFVAAMALTFAIRLFLS